MNKADEILIDTIVELKLLLPMFQSELSPSKRAIYKAIRILEALRSKDREKWLRVTDDYSIPNESMDEMILGK